MFLMQHIFVTTQVHRGKGTQAQSVFDYLLLNFLIKLLSIRSIQVDSL